MYTFEQLKEDVRKEAEALKVHATKEELGRLDFFKLDPNSVQLCVYGQVCGACDNNRARLLMDKCAPTFFKGIPYMVSSLDAYESSEGGLNWSPIETYIYQPEAKNENLIAFLKGESETLEL